MDIQSADSRTGKIEAFWITGGDRKKVWSGGRDETGQKIPQIVDMVKASKP